MVNSFQKGKRMNDKKEKEGRKEKERDKSSETYFN